MYMRTKIIPSSVTTGNASANAASSGKGNEKPDSLLGSLHSANASSTAFSHANAKSRVGQLALYMDAMVVYTDAFETADWGQYDSLMDEYDALVAEAEALASALQGLTEDTRAYDTQLAALAAKRAEADAKLAKAEAVIADVTVAQQDAAGYLAGAANKDSVIHDSETGVAEIINPPAD